MFKIYMLSTLGLVIQNVGYLRKRKLSYSHKVTIASCKKY